LTQSGHELLAFAATHRPESLYDLLYLTGDRVSLGVSP